MEDNLIQTARAHAERILLANGGELGLLGSNQACQQVWARDSMICGGSSGRPMGFSVQSWSAAMYIFAADAVEHGQVQIFNSDHGWTVGNPT